MIINVNQQLSNWLIIKWSLTTIKFAIVFGASEIMKSIDRSRNWVVVFHVGNRIEQVVQKLSISVHEINQFLMENWACGPSPWFCLDDNWQFVSALMTSPSLMTLWMPPCGPMWSHVHPCPMCPAGHLHQVLHVVVHTPLRLEGEPWTPNQTIQQGPEQRRGIFT